MEFIVYSHPENSQKNLLKKEISRVTGVMPAMVFNFESLFKLIKSKLFGEFIIIFLISSKEELEYLNLNKAYLFHSRFIIIIPNEEEDLISRSLSLYPRYLTNINREFKDVSAVLRKMMKQYCKIVQKKN